MRIRDLEGWTIAFDLDGTLVDSAPDLIGTLNRMLAPRDYPPVPLSSARHLVGHGVRPLLRHGFAEAGAVWDETAEPDLFDLFLDDYVAHIADDSRPFEGVVETLDCLSARGALLCVATNKRTDLAEALIGALGLTRHFVVIAGPDRVSARKPDDKRDRSLRPGRLSECLRPGSVRYLLSNSEMWGRYGERGQRCERPHSPCDAGPVG